jgi:hypothetical protein
VTGQVGDEIIGPKPEIRKNRRRLSDDSENRKPIENDRQQATDADYKEWITDRSFELLVRGNRQQTTDNRQQTSGNRQQTTDDGQRT